MFLRLQEEDVGYLLRLLDEDAGRCRREWRNSKNPESGLPSMPWSARMERDAELMEKLNR